VSQKLSRLYSEMIFDKGFVHCDPHPGNVLINNHKGYTEIVLLDHGLYTVSYYELIILSARLCIDDFCVGGYPVNIGYNRLVSW